MKILLYLHMYQLTKLNLRNPGGEINFVQIAVPISTASSSISNSPRALGKPNISTWFTHIN